MSSAGDWAELLRLPALFTVPGDALAGAAAGGGRPGARTLGAVAASLCLYSAGMALNDWADREEDARERPGRPLPSGRVAPGAALAAAGALTAAGLGCAALAGRRATAVAAPLAATVWAYDLWLKRTPFGPVAMGAARALDLLLGAAASTGRVRGAVPSALAVGAHTCAVTTVSRHETRGGAVLPAVTALAATAVVTAALTRGRTRGPGPGPGLGRAAGAAPGARPPLGPADAAGPAATRGDRAVVPRTPLAALTPLAAAAYAATAARPLLHAVLNPSPQLTQRAVGGGIRALVPLQAALAARADAPVSALLTAALAPVARRLGRKVSLT
ncbi:SCO3242 family prenyltransferase [Streptomyces abyssomicinicus]|uniref:SCO3242 family prenyltransferase n=1 Tax=Streptomyces abyssomicinicus TaxID=574929 RepID=UPI00124F86CB|nr:UbiA family prenyltransferase [Streptomyces abyssomicinicus]